MKVKNKYIYSIIAVFLIVVGYLVITSQPNNSVSDSVSVAVTRKEADIYTHKIIVGENTIKGDIADSEDEARIGLSGRQKMCEDCGLYFDLGYENTIPTFWMKDMLFPIDIIWIDDGKVVDITKNIPPPEPNTPDYQLPKYRPNQKIDYVLEVNAGYSDGNNIKVGDSVTLNNN